MFTYLQNLIDKKQDIHAWINDQEKLIPIPLYTSVDIRDSGFKTAIVDTNLFPAGFNNISPTDWPKASEAFKTYITKQLPSAKHILIIAEEHTRNKFYVQNIATLQTLLQNAGFDVKTATFLDPKTDSICKENHDITLESADGTDFHLYCLHYYLDLAEKNEVQLDAIVYNNDLTSGLPERLKKLQIPAFPHPILGWYNRRKSEHFTQANTIIEKFAKAFDLDPWLYNTLFTTEESVSINDDNDRERLAKKASQLLQTIQNNYDNYGIKEKPTLFLKADSGTYGMGVMPIQSAEDILNLNRKSRNNLSKGKSSQIISNFLIQEGVPTRLAVNDQVGEPCLYLANNTLIGTFYRLNNQKSNTENLNSQGMSFLSMPLSNSGIPYIEAYGILARLYTLAAGCELLEKKSS